jgi:hypothetical protein
MEDFNPATWIELLKHNPVLEVILGGLLLGTAITQAVKKTWLAFADTTRITQARYRVSCMWLAILSTMFATYVMFHTIIAGVDAHGLGKVVAVSSGIAAPLVYVWTRALIKWKFPALAAAMSDNGAAFKTP